MITYYLNKNRKLIYCLENEAKNGIIKKLGKGIKREAYDLDRSEKISVISNIKLEKWLNPNNLPNNPSADEINDYLARATRLYVIEKDKKTSEKGKDFRDIDVINLIIGLPVFQKLKSDKGIVLKYNNVLDENFYIGISLDRYF